MKHAIITGGSSGIGKATAILLAQQGYHLSLIARDPLKLDQAKTEIETFKINPQQQIITLSADVKDKIQVENSLKLAIEKNGIPDLLITSAGIAHPGYFQDLSLEIFENTMAINYFGSLYSIKTVLPFMEERKQGQIVLISSGAGLIGIYGYTPYCPSKFALRGLAESLRGELKSAGIYLSIVYPPDTDTPQLVAENQTKPQETKLITGSAKTWTAEAVAQEIIKGIKQKKFIISPGLEMKILARFHSLISPLLQWYFDTIVSSVKKQKSRLDH